MSGNKTSIGGIYNHFGGRITITNSTITNNTAPSGRGTGVASFGNTATRTEVRSSVISPNPGSDVDLFVFNGISTNSFDCKGYNLIGDANATAEFDQTGDQSGVTAPKLGTLRGKGGPTKTHALLPESPAIDKGKSFGDSTDQRGEQRPINFPNIANASGGDGSDIGAFEVQDPPPTVSVAAATSCGTDDLLGTIRLRVADAVDSASSLTLRATSSNPALVPNSNISFSGTGSIRTLKVTALSGSIGTATLALRVSDPSKATGTVALTLKAGGNSKDTLAGTSQQQSSSRSVSPESRRCLRPEELLRPRTSPPAASRARGLPPNSTS